MIDISIRLQCLNSEDTDDALRLMAFSLSSKPKKGSGERYDWHHKFDVAGRLIEVHALISSGEDILIDGPIYLRFHTADCAIGHGHLCFGYSQAKPLDL